MTENAERDRSRHRTRGIGVGEIAPDFELPLLSNQGEKVKLSALRGRPSVLVFGSYSCTRFFEELPAVDQLHRKFGREVAFHLVYMREQHPDQTFMDGPIFQQCNTLDERAENARRFPFEVPVLLDLMDDMVGTVFGARPNRTYLIDKDGRVIYRDKGGSTMNASELATAIQTHLANPNKEVVREPNPDFQKIKFSEIVDAKALTAHIEALARQFSESKFILEADGEALSFDLMGNIEFELQGDYNPHKKKYSVTVDIDWRDP